MSTSATLKPTEFAAGTPAWHFSLGDAFRALTICGLAMLLVVQFGPLAAARDVGAALAIGLAAWAWTARSRRLGFLAGLIATAGMIPTVLAAGAPFSIRDAVCLECGQTRHVREVCGWKTRDEIRETECSQWAAPLVPLGHQHLWSISSRHERTQWFGSSCIGCGRPGEGAFMAWQLARLGDHAAGVAAYQEYLDIRTGKSPKSMAVHQQEVSAAVNAVLARRADEGRR